MVPQAAAAVTLRAGSAAPEAGDRIVWRDAGSILTVLSVRPRGWGWFTAWLVIGGMSSFAVISIMSVRMFRDSARSSTGAAVAPSSNGRGIAGLLSGLGLPAFYVAYLNRQGAGTVCSSHAGPPFLHPAVEPLAVARGRRSTTRS